MSGIAITFPSSPTEGQSYLAQNGFTYIYDSQKNRWKRGGEFVRSPKVLYYAGVAATTTGAGIITGPTGALLYNIPGVVLPNSEVGVDSYKAYRASDSYPNYTEVQVSISSAFSTIAYAATFTGTTHTIPSNTLSGDTTYYLRARQFVGSSAAAAGVGAISGYSQNPVRFITTSVYLDTPTIVSIAGDTDFPAYQVGFAGSTLPATVTYFGSGVGNLRQVEWRVTGPRNPDSTGDTALAEVGIGTFSSATLANALVLAMPFSGATGVGITNDVNGAIRTASGASAGTAKTMTHGGGISIVNVGIATTTAHFYNNAAFFNSTSAYLDVGYSINNAFVQDSYTVEFWMRPTVSNTEMGVFGKGPFNGGYYWSGWISSGNNFSFNPDDQTYVNNVSLGPITAETWTHVACVYDKTRNIAYGFINGVLKGAKVLASSPTVTTGNLQIGYYYSTVYYFRGYLQDFKIYSGVAKYQENFTPPLPTYGTISYTTRTIGSVGVATTAFFESTGDIPLAEVAIGSSTAAQVASSLVLAMPMNRTFGFQDINVAVRGLTSGASAGTAKTVGLGTTSTANAPTHPRISATESKWYDGAAYFDGGDYATIPSNSDFNLTSNSLTAECWVYLTSTSDGPTIISNAGRGGTAYSNYTFTLSSGKFRCYLGNATSPGNIVLDLYSVSTVSTGRWYHLALSVTGGGTARFFVDGILQASGTPGTLSVTSGNPFQIGYEINQPTTSYLYGYIQDLKVYNGLAKYTANFTPPRPICGFTTDLAIQTGFTTTSATGVALTSIVGLGSTSTLAFAADQTYAGVTSITSSSGITTLPDPYAQNLVLALPLANITGVGNSFTNDRNTQIRSVSITGAGVTAGTTKTITNTGVTTVSLGSTNLYYGNIAQFGSGRVLTASSSSDFNFGTGDFTVEYWLYRTSLGNNDAALTNFSQVSSGYFICLHAGTGFNDASLYLNGSMVVQGGTPQANVWNHYAYVRSSGNCRIYKNGILIASTTSSATAGATNVMNIGAYSDGTSAVTGYMQDVRIYNGLAKYTTNFTPPPPMFGDYTRSTPNKIVFTPGSDYVLEARNTATGGIVTSVYSATRQWGTKPKGGIYDPYGANLVLAIPGGAVGGATSTFDVTGQIRYETPTTSYVNAGIVTYSNSLGIGTYQNKTVTNTNVSISSTITKYYSRSMDFIGNSTLKRLDINTANSNFGFGTGPFTFEWWMYATSNASGNFYVFDTIGQPIALIRKSTGGMTLETGGSSGAIGEVTILSSGSYGLNKWTHWAVVRNGTNVSVYIDGILTQSTNGFSGVNFGDANGAIGASNNSTSASFNVNAYLSDFRIYKGVAKYTSNFTPPNQIYLT